MPFCADQLFVHCPLNIAQRHLPMPLQGWFDQKNKSKTLNVLGHLREGGIKEMLLMCTKNTWPFLAAHISKECHWTKYRCFDVAEQLHAMQLCLLACAPPHTFTPQYQSIFVSEGNGGQLQIAVGIWKNALNVQFGSFNQNDFWTFLWKWLKSRNADWMSLSITTCLLAAAAASADRR